VRLRFFPVITGSLKIITAKLKVIAGKQSSYNYVFSRRKGNHFILIMQIFALF
jgi:hypothetical protein